MVWVCSYGVPDCPECKRDGRRLRWQAEAPSATATTDRVYFRIPYTDKEAAKQLGARWDADRKCWYGLGANPRLSEIGKRWPPVSPPKPSGKSPPVPRASAVPDLFDVTATVPEAPTAQPDPDPPPGLFSFDELMDAIKAADAANAPQAADRLPVAPSKKDNANAR